MHPLVSEKLTFELMNHISSPARLLGVNAALAKQRAIFRLRLVNEDCFHNEVHEPFSLEETSDLVIKFIRHIKDFHDLKGLDGKLAEKKASYRLTVLPDEPDLENMSAEELELISMTHFGHELGSHFQLSSIEEIVSNPQQLTISYLQEAENTLSELRARHIARDAESEDRKDCDVLKSKLTDNCEQQRWNKGFSKFYGVLKPLEDKLKRGNGKLAKWMREREQRRWAQESEKEAWGTSERVWRMSMLDEEWWIRKRRSHAFHPVWNHVYHDLAPERSNMWSDETE